MAAITRKTSVFYDPDQDRLCYYRETAGSDYWDRLWEDLGQARVRDMLRAPRAHRVRRITRKFLKPPDGPILEGGCGLGGNVATLAQRGYECIGVDLAPTAIRRTKSIVPDLDVRVADVRELPFPNDYFAGYWSLGVIEHFYEGFSDVAKEMRRVIRKGGYLFLGFPAMNPLRRLKRSLGLYRCYSRSQGSRGFYQYVLNPEAVSREVEDLGFSLVLQRRIVGLGGFKEDGGVFGAVAGPILAYNGRSILIRGPRRILDMILAPVAGHSKLMVFVKTGR